MKGSLSILFSTAFYYKDIWIVLVTLIISFGCMWNLHPNTLHPEDILPKYSSQVVKNSIRLMPPFILPAFSDLQMRSLLKQSWYLCVDDFFLPMMSLHFWNAFWKPFWWKKYFFSVELINDKSSHGIIQLEASLGGYLISQGKDQLCVFKYWQFSDTLNHVRPLQKICASALLSLHFGCGGGWWWCGESKSLMWIFLLQFKFVSSCPDSPGTWITDSFFPFAAAFCAFKGFCHSLFTQAFLTDRFPWPVIVLGGLFCVASLFFSWSTSFLKNVVQVQIIELQLKILLVLNKEGILLSFRLYSCLSCVILASCIPVFFKICSLASQVLFRFFFPLKCWLSRLRWWMERRSCDTEQDVMEASNFFYWTIW